VSGSNGVDRLTSRTALHLSATAGPSLRGFKEQAYVVWGVIVSIYITIVQGETVRPKATVNRVKDNEVNYLLTNLALRITIPFRYAHPSKWPFCLRASVHTKILSRICFRNDTFVHPSSSH